MQNAFLRSIWMNMIRVANGLLEKPVFGFMGCHFYHEQNTIPCAHVTKSGHNEATCKFDHTYYRNPTAEENEQIKQKLEKDFKSSTPTSRPAPATAAPAATAATVAAHQKATDQQPPFQAPAGKYWEQTEKGGWALKIIPSK